MFTLCCYCKSISYWVEYIPSCTSKNVFFVFVLYCFESVFKYLWILRSETEFWELGMNADIIKKEWKCVHCKPVPCNENRGFPVKFSHREIPVIKTGVPAMRTGVPCNENRFFPVWKTSQGKPCSGPVRDCSAFRNSQASKLTEYPSNSPLKK